MPEDAKFIIETAEKLIKRGCPTYMDVEGYGTCRYCGCSIREGKHHAECPWNNLKNALGLTEDQYGRVT